MYPKIDDADNIRTLLEKCGDFFMAMGDNVRRSLFIDMAEAGYKGVNVSTLTAKTKLSRPAVSHHLKILKNCGLIKSHRIGTMNFYYINVQETLDHVKDFVATAEKLIAADASFIK